MSKHDYIIIDRDGVLNTDRPDYVKSVAECHLIDGSLRALARLHQARVRVLVATNQACIGKQLVTRATVDAIHRTMSACVAAHGGYINHFFVCPHRAEHHCACRKPRPGLLREAATVYGLSLAHTWFIGDSVRDIEAGERAGCRVALVRTGKGEASHRARPDVPVFADLSAFVGAYLDSSITGQRT